MSTLDKIIQQWNEQDTPIEERLAEALRIIERMQKQRLELDRRIHNQRKACSVTWEIVEMRRKWLGSDAARRSYINLLKRYHKLLRLDQVKCILDMILDFLLAIVRGAPPPPPPRGIPLLFYQPFV